MLANTIDSAALTANLRYYEDHAEEYVQSTVGLDLSELHEAFLRNLPAQAFILDAGCGSGRDSAAFLARGYRVKAIDASPAMVHAGHRIGVPAKLLTFQEIQFEAEFDGIWACASLLHVPRSEIREVLQRLARALRSGGVLLITLKKGAGEGFADDGRFFAYYESEEFAELLRSMGCWLDLEVRQTADERRRPWLNFLARKAACRPIIERT